MISSGTSRLRIARLIAATVAVLALIATSCGGSSSGETSSAETAAVASSASEPVVEADSSESAPAISLVASTIGGGQIDFGSLQGQDVVLWYWAPW